MLQEPLEKQLSDKKNPILYFGLLVFTLGTFTSETFLSSLNVQNIYLMLTIVLLFVYYLFGNKEIFVTRIEILWSLFFLYLFINILVNGQVMKIFISDFLVYFMFIVFLALTKVEIKYYKSLINIIVLITFLYAVGSFFQYWNMNLYSNTILPLFTNSEQEELLMLYNNGSYTGFTWQTAFVSGYLVCGIGLLTLRFKYIEKLSYKLIVIIMIIIMLAALFLGGKRAHLIFMIISLIITYTISVTNKTVTKYIYRSVITVTLTVMGYYLIFRNYIPDINTPFGKLYYRFSNTIADFKAGNDITSGRTELYDFALNLFIEKPIFGIGWREFSQISRGVIHSRVGSHPHNIYIQLLIEFGIIGFILFLIPVVYTLFKTIKLLRNSNLLFYDNKLWKILIQFSLYYQLFFIGYGMTGNLLTDHMYLLIYLFVSSITYSAIYAKKKMRIYT